MPEERKLVTILFSDVTGSTALGEELDPEDVRALMGRYYDHARRIVSDHGGTLEKFIGDAVMAVFGLPHAHSDDAERAVAAALALRRAIEGDRQLPDVMLRIGVNTGEVVASPDRSSGDFLVTGDAVNVAARLQQAAQPGEILASHRTQAATRAAFLFDDPREMAVKGKSEPVRVFAVVGVRPVRQVDRPPLVGRKRELSQLSLLQAWALEERRPQLVSIVAPAGTGKTRLLEEFQARLPADEGWRVAVGRCLPYGRSLSYWPLRGLLQDLVGAIKREPLCAAFEGSGYSREDASRLTDLVLAPLGIESETLPEREAIFNAWRLLVETLATEAPRIVVFEDLHWASDSLLDLVEHLMHPRTKAALLLIAISRPELLDRRPAWGSGGRQSLTTLVLEPLNEAQTGDLVEHLGSSLPAAIRQRIVERSGGNPFFATELVRGMEERLAGGDGQSPEAVPDTVHAAVLARIDALSPAERTVAQAAAVAGRGFRSATLAAVLESMDPAEIAASIDGLVARDLAVPTAGDAFTFRHVLIRDVAYGTLSRAERIRMHAAVAAWLEDYAAGAVDEFVELIAYHYREAVVLSQRSAAPVQLPFDPARVISFLERAGELASRSGALGEARSHFESAIALAPEGEHIRLYEKLGDSLVGGYAALTAYGEALQRWRDTGAADPVTGARLLRKLLILHTRWQTAQPTAEKLGRMAAEARQLAEQAGDEDETWRITVAEIFCLWLGGPTADQGAEGRSRALAAAEHFERRGDWDAFSEALDAYIALALRAGLRQEIIEAARRRLAAPSLHPAEHADALGMMLSAHSALGEYERCLAIMHEALAQIRPGDPLAGCAMALASASWAAYVSGRWSDVDDFTRVQEEARQQEDPLAGNFWPALAVALARQDGPAVDAAVSAITGMYFHEGEAGPHQLFMRAWLATLVEDDPALLDPDLAQHIDGDGLDHVAMFLSEHGFRAPQTVLDKVANQAGTAREGTTFWCLQIVQALRAAAPARLERAIDEAEQHGLIPHAARMRVVLAEMTGDPTPLERARPVLERLEDRQFLRRLEDVGVSLR